MVQFGGCRYGKNCRFAHNYEELAEHQAALEAEEQRRKANKNCKSFFAVKFCHHGPNCAYRHEYRHIDQIHRYYYVQKLISKEVMYKRCLREANKESNGEPIERRLSIFRSIQALGEKELGKDQSPSRSEDSYQDFTERTLGSSNGTESDKEDSVEMNEPMQLDLSLGEIPNVD